MMVDHGGISSVSMTQTVTVFVCGAVAACATCVALKVRQFLTCSTQE